jgi:hypothetical protein
LSDIIFSGTYFPLCGVDEAMVYVNGTDGGTAEELGRGVVVMVHAKSLETTIFSLMGGSKSKG